MTAPPFVGAKHRTLGSGSVTVDTPAGVDANDLLLAERKSEAGMTVEDVPNDLCEALDAIAAGEVVFEGGEHLHTLAEPIEACVDGIKALLAAHELQGPDARRLVRTLARSATALRSAARDLDTHRRAAAGAQEAAQRLRERGVGT